MKKVIVIGASTGGPSTLEKLLCGLPEHLGVPIIVIQHMPGIFTTPFARRLSNLCHILITEAQEGELIMSDHAYIVPGDYHFFFESPGPRVHLLHESRGLSPSVDMGMISAADHYGPGVIGIILSGMGNDGLIGAKAVRQVGGRVLVQDESTSAIYGMPKAVYDAGYADEVLPLDRIAPRIIELLGQNYAHTNRKI